jgi:hypothetical protein
VGFTILNFLKRAGQGLERVTPPLGASFKVIGAAPTPEPARAEGPRGAL